VILITNQELHLFHGHTGVRWGSGPEHVVVRDRQILGVREIVCGRPSVPTPRREGLPTISVNSAVRDGA
jgi:hypothetical protein